MTDSENPGAYSDHVPGEMMLADAVEHWVEPTFNVAVEDIVVTALIMWLMRLSGATFRTRAKDREPASAITPAIRHVPVKSKVVPTRRERLPVSPHALCLETGHYFRARQKGISVPTNILIQILKLRRHG